MQRETFVRQGSYIEFAQLGIKLELDVALDQAAYFEWLDALIQDLPRAMPGAKVVEREYARSEPRLNTGVYYDTPDRDLLKLGAVLRTTCNKKTHAFCAFKLPEDSSGVRQDHRHVFEGEEKSQIQRDPAAEESVEIVRRLLMRTDVDQPGRRLLERYGISPTDLTPSVLLPQYRHPFFVWLDGEDALRCVMDRAEARDLRFSTGPALEFAELEIPIYPRIAAHVRNDARLTPLMNAIAESACEWLGATRTPLNKYQRAGRLLRVG